MRLINSKVEEITQQNGLTGIKKMIEIAGRTCYKSEDKITDESCEEFVERMINSKHYSMLEHGTVYMTIDLEETHDIQTPMKYMNNKYSKVAFENGTYYITTNYRVIVENNWYDDLKYVTDKTEYHKQRRTYRFICDRGISHELVRHRTMSFAQESTRYCNYNKDKFNNELTFIIPTWLENKLPEGNYVYWDGDWCDLEQMRIQHASDNGIEDNFLWSLQNSEDYYTLFINKGLKPQEARQILPNALKTEVVVTAFDSDWDNFFNLRCPNSAHPDMRKLAREIYSKHYNHDWMF